MIVLGTSQFFWSSLFLYLLAALLALFLTKSPKLCNLITQATCMLAAAAGLAAALVHIFSGRGSVVLADIRGTVPLMSLRVSMDNLSAFFLVGLSILTFCVSLYSISYLGHYVGKKNLSLFNFLYATFILSMALVFTSGNAVLFLIAWEAMSVISYFLVVYESEHEESLRAGSIYLIMTSIGTAFLLTAIMVMFSFTGSFNLSGDFGMIPEYARNLMFICLLLGFGMKAGIVPLHIWLPYAHPAAPSNVSALMSGIMIKTAIYGLLRFVLICLGVEKTWWGIVILVIGLVSAVFGVAYAFVESNMKKLLAYSSIENIGIILIGLGTGLIAAARGNQAVSAVAIAAALFHAFNHTFFKGSLFLGAGSVHFATHTKNMEEMGGLIKKMPATSLLVLGGSLSISALVPFNGFASEWLTFQAIFQSFSAGSAWINIAMMLAAALLALAGALAAACFMKLFGISFLGKARGESAAAAKEVPLPMVIGNGILVLLCLVLGLFPSLFIRLADGAVSDLTGQSLSGLLSGWLVLKAGPAADIAAGTISPLAMLIALVAVILAGMLVVRLVGGKYIERKYGTWDCGFNALNSRMQYSAMGFAKPIKIVFRFLFRPSRELKVDGSLTYYPERLEYTVKTESLVEKYLYAPLTDFVKRLSVKTKESIQTGSIRRYLAYILLALLVVMLYNVLYKGVG